MGSLYDKDDEFCAACTRFIPKSLNEHTTATIEDIILFFCGYCVRRRGTEIQRVITEITREREALKETK